MEILSSGKGKPTNLRIAVRIARAEVAEQRDAQEDLQQAELARLSMLKEAIRPIIDQAPADVDLFDLGITHSGRARLFLDMISFVDLGHDRRTFRFFQDTRHGRVLIAQSESPDKVIAAVTNYVARRLVERERALAADWRARSGQEIGAKFDHPELFGAVKPQKKLSNWTFAFSALGFCLMVLGSVTLCVVLLLVIQAVWERYG